MKKIFASIVFMLMAVTSWAHDVEVDGIYYNIIEKAKEAHVTYKGTSYSEYNNEYSGSVTIPASFEYNGATFTVTSIGERAFSGCSGLTSVTIPNSVTSIRDDAFYYCSGLTSVHISSLESWCNIIFSSIYSNPLYYAHHLYINDTEVKDLVIPNSVTSIGTGAFYGCSGLTSVIIPNSVTSIGASAFYSCSGLTSVTIPNSVTSIGIHAFHNCIGLTSVTIGNSVTKIGNFAFYGCSGLTSVIIPNSVTSIENCAFYICSGLTSVTIPNSVKSIGDRAFYGCTGLTSVTIGNSVEYIGTEAFSKCNKLETVTCLAENVPNTYTNAFFESYVNYSTLNVPEASLRAYRSTAPWRDFGTILPICVETPVVSIIVNAESNTLYKGDKATLTVTILPENATNKTVVWTSSNSNVVSVDANTGEITAVGCGEAVITAIATDGSKVSGSITIAVKNAGYELVDGTPFSNAEQFTCDQLTYTRTFSDNNWQALYVPFSMQYDDWKDNFEIAYLNDVHQFDDDDDGVIDRTVLESIKLKQGSKTEPNTPYMIKTKTVGCQTITLADATLYPAAENSFDVSSWFTKFIFTGTYNTVTDMATAGHYAMAKGGLMQATSDAAILGAFRWYLDVTDRYGNPTSLASKSICLSFDDGETTDIDIINADSPQNDKVYSVNGMQMKGKLPKGLYIINGKKVVIK